MFCSHTGLYQATNKSVCDFIKSTVWTMLSVKYEIILHLCLFLHRVVILYYLSPKICFIDDVGIVGFNTEIKSEKC